MIPTLGNRGLPNSAMLCCQPRATSISSGLGLGNMPSTLLRQPQSANLRNPLKKPSYLRAVWDWLSILFRKKNYLGESEEKSNSTRWVESIINFVFYSLLASMTIDIICCSINSCCATCCRTSFIACWFCCPTATIKICFKISLSVCGSLIPNLQEKFNNQIQLQL